MKCRMKLNLKGYRKVCIGLLVIGIGVLMDLSVGLSTNLLYLLLGIGGTLMTMNGVEHLAEAKKSGKTDNNEVQAYVARIDESMQIISAQVAQNTDSANRLDQGYKDVVGALSKLANAASVLGKR